MTMILARSAGPGPSGCSLFKFFLFFLLLCPDVGAGVRTKRKERKKELNVWVHVPTRSGQSTIDWHSVDPHTRNRKAVSGERAVSFSFFFVFIHRLTVSYSLLWPVDENDKEIKENE